MSLMQMRVKQLYQLMMSSKIESRQITRTDTGYNITYAMWIRTTSGMHLADSPVWTLTFDKDNIHLLPEPLK